jgi:hypothetical protein
MAIFWKTEKHPAPSGIFHTYIIPAIAVLTGLFLLNCGGGSSSPPAVTPTTTPSITSISPDSIQAGSDSFTLTVNGANFNSSSIVRWNGAARSTDYISSTRLTAAISSSDIAIGRTRTITVRNTSPTVAFSNGVTFNVNNLVPTITFLSPSSIPAETESFTLTIWGRNFLSNSSLQWNDNTISGNYVDSTQFIFTISSSYIANEATVDVGIYNPEPGGGLSNLLPFNVKAPGLSVLTLLLPDAYSSKSYSYALQAEGGISPYTWSLAGGSLPNGLTLSLEGKISGTAPNVASDTSFPFTIDLNDNSQPAGTNMISQDFSILVKSGSLGRNDSCSAAAATPVSNGILHASISPYGDIDVYSFQGTQGSQVTVEIFAQRLDLDEDPASQDIYLDSFLEILDDGCTQVMYNDDIDLGIVYDSLISNYILPYTGTYYIRVSDLRGDGRPDLQYNLSLSGAD